MIEFYSPRRKRASEAMSLTKHFLNAGRPLLFCDMADGRALC